jgi:2-furoyl-CoA dehydrogenase large subunit
LRSTTSRRQSHRSGSTADYGRPQFYFALERIMEIAGRGLISMSPNCGGGFIPAHAFPYQAPAGAVFDAGNYDEAVRAVAPCRL